VAPQWKPCGADIPPPVTAACRLYKDAQPLEVYAAPSLSVRRNFTMAARRPDDDGSDAVQLPKPPSLATPQSAAETLKALQRLDFLQHACNVVTIACAHGNSDMLKVGKADVLVRMR
jgi:hypothetical protein